MSGIGAPQAKSQSSRKGRKAWRKNVDVSDVQKGLEENIEEVIQHGIKLSDAQSEDLFFIDEEADEATEEKLVKDNVKKLKASEILANKSKVKPLYEEGKITKPRKVQGVTKKEMNRLLRLAGKVQGYDKYEQRLSEDGIIKSKAFDVWNTLTAEEKRLAELPAPLKEQSVASFTVANKVPKTLKEAPLKIKNIEVIPHAGKSYNPTYENWKDLIDSEYYKEKTHDDKRNKLEEFHARLQYIMDNDHHSEVESSGSEDEEEVQQEEEEDDDEKYRLSVNAVTERKIKTKTKRNKEQRHLERVKIETEIKELKAHIKMLEQLPEILDEVLTSEQDQLSKPTESRGERKLRRGTRKLGKFDVIEGPIEVKLSNELSDSLRKLKPEGNLLYDQMKRMQAKGMIETRRGRDRKSGKKKNTEKWSYKDFK